MASTKGARREKQHEQDLMFLVAYILPVITWLSGIVVFLVAKRSDKRLRTNALQATFLGIAATILFFIPVVGWVVAFVLWIVGIIAGAKAYEGEDVSLPFIGDYARKSA